MKRGLWALTALLLLPVAEAAGQTPESRGDLNREMDVTRAYEPTVDKATKLNVKPDMTDTMTLRPEMSYRISPNPVSYGFEVEPIRAAQVNTSLYRNPSPLYLKAGLGVPFQSLLDFYYSPKGNGRGKFGVYLNHYGQWSKIANDMDIKAPAAETFNSAGIFGEHRFGRMSVSGGIGADFDKVSRYGYYAPVPGPAPIDTTANGLRQNFTTVRGNVMLGHAFEDLSYFNFRIGLDAAYFADRADNAETGIKGRIDMGKQFGGSELTLGLRYEGYFGSKNLSDYQDNLVSIVPLYRFRTSKFDFALGFDVTLNNYKAPGDADSRHNDWKFFPQLKVKADIGSGYFIPYLEIDGKMNNNGYRNLTARNPYAFDGLLSVDNPEYNGRVGFMGNFSSAFSYKVYGGATFYRNLPLFYNLCYYGIGDISEGNLFGVLVDDTRYWTAGAEIEGRVGGSFGVEAGVQYRGYKMDGFDEPFNFPKLTARLALKYNYRDRLILTLGGELAGPRDMIESAVGADGFDLVLNPVGTTFDLRVGAEYNVSRRIGVFLNGNNLLNQKLYRFNRYPGLGINALAGVKLQF